MKKIYPLFDCDIHPSANATCPITPFVPTEFREAVAQHMASAPAAGYSNPFGVDRRDVPFRDVNDLREYHLDRFPIMYGVVQSPGYAVTIMHQNDLANAMARAWNEWQVENYLSQDARLLGSLAVNLNDPQGAVREIEHWAGDRRFCQILTTSAQDRLLGHRAYDPVYAACEEAGLIFALHPGREGSRSLPTPHGWPSTYFEWHNILPIHFMDHLNSMVCEGVFERHPRLKVMLTEGGIGWLPHLMWRMDKNFKALRATTPWLRELPSHYILEHVRLTTQPVEEPENPAHLAAIFEMVHAEKTVLFSSDFPHWDFDDPDYVLPRTISEETKRRVFYENALELFGRELPTQFAPAPELVEVA